MPLSHQWGVLEPHPLGNKSGRSLTNTPSPPYVVYLAEFDRCWSDSLSVAYVLEVCGSTRTHGYNTCAVQSDSPLEKLGPSPHSFLGQQN